MAKDQLTRARAAINEDANAAQALSDAIAEGEAMGLYQWGEALKTAPRGFAKDHPYIALLRKKNYVLARSCSDWDLITSSAIYDWALEGWAAAKPLVDWCDRYVGPTEMTYEERFGNRKG